MRRATGGDADLPVPCGDPAGPPGPAGGGSRRRRPAPAAAGIGRGRTGQTRSDAAGAEDTLRTDEYREDELRPDAAGRHPAACASVADSIAPVHLSLPLWHPDVRRKIVFEIPPSREAIAAARQQATRTPDQDFARIAAGLLDAGILVSSDWTGQIRDSIEAGLSRWLIEQGVPANNSPMPFLSLRITDDIEFGLELDGYDGVNGWWGEFGRKDCERRTVGNDITTPPIGAFAFQAHGEWKFMSLRPWGTRLAREFGETTAASIIGVLDRASEMIGAVTPSWAYDRTLDWYAGCDGDEEECEGLTPDSFARKVPEYAMKCRFDVEEIRRAATSPYHDPRCVRVAAAALDLAEAYNAASDEHVRRKGNRTPFSGYLRHSHFFHELAPPLFIAWSGKVGDDPCVRVFDDHGEMIVQDDHTDICWIHGFDVLKPGDDETPGTLPHAIHALKVAVSTLVPLLQLIAILDKRCPPAPRPDKNPRALMNILGRGNDSEDAQLEEAICAL